MLSEGSWEALRAASLGMNYFIELLVTGWEGLGGYNPANVSDPQVDAMIDALRATTDLEEYQRRFREIDMYSIEQHWFIWSPAVPMYLVSQPWLKGYNGEATMGNWQFNELYARLWIDQELKAEMGR